MAARADIWLRYKDKARGKIDSWYFKDTRLKTRDAKEARERARLAKAGKWPPPEEAAAKVSVESFELRVEDPGLRAKLHEMVDGGADQAAVGPDPVTKQPGVTESETVAAPPSADWTNVAAAAAADAGATPPLKPEVVNPQAEQEEREATNGDIAGLVVHFQLVGTDALIKAKVYDKFQAPIVSDEKRAQLAAPYKAMMDYGGKKLKLPPWVTGLLIPGITAIMGAAAMSREWAELARQQKARDEYKGPQPVADGA